MGTIKGQNLRLFIEGRCVAAATTCSVHTATQMESLTTKDSDGDWGEQEPVGLSWDASCEALVTDGIYEYADGLCDHPIEIAQGGTVYSDGRLQKLPPGMTLFANIKGSSHTVTIFSPEMLLAADISSVEYTNMGSEPIYVYAGSNYEGDQLIHYQIDERRLGFADLRSAQDNRMPVEVHLSLATGSKNADEDETWLSGDGYISDMQITAANRSVATLSVQISGTGELRASDDSYEQPPT